MARERTPLTEKEERILVQAQLMGLSTASMVKIGNRLRALEKEREAVAELNDAVHGFSWEGVQTANNLSVVTPKGYTVTATRSTGGKSYWRHYNWYYEVVISKPGTRFKERRIDGVELRVDYNWKKKHMPANSKELYALINWCRNQYNIDMDLA